MKNSRQSTERAKQIRWVKLIAGLASGIVALGVAAVLLLRSDEAGPTDKVIVRNQSDPEPAMPAPAPSVVTSATPNTGWMQFRGPDYNVTQERDLPTRWSATENIAWKASMPGMGSSSPIVVGDRVFITAYSGYGLDKDKPGDPQNLRRHLICLDRPTGRELWRKDIASPHGPFPFQGFMHLHGYASHTPCSDGRRVYALFGNAGVYAFDLDGNQLWKTDVGRGTDSFGSGGSPVLIGGKLIVNASIESQKLIALNPDNGGRIWEAAIKRAFSTPIGVPVDGGLEIVSSTDGGRGIVGFDARTGEELWNVGGWSRRYTCASPIFAEGLIFGTGSVDGPLAAIRPGGRGDVRQSHEVWRARPFQNDVVSPVYHDGKVWWVNGAQFVAYDAKTGQVAHRDRWTRRPIGAFGTPLVAGDRIYLQTQNNGVFVLRLGERLTEIAHNRFERDRPKFPGNASPVAHNGQLLLRSLDVLYCVGAR